MLLCAGACIGAVVVLDDFSVRQESYPLVLGNEYPGAKAVIAWTEQGNFARGAIKIDYDFSGGGVYCQWMCTPPDWITVNGTTLAFYAKSKPETRIIVRVVDSTGQTHQYNMSLHSSGWEKFELLHSDTALHEHFGGANDDLVHGPITQILIGPTSSSNGTGSLSIDDVQFLTTVSETELALAKTESDINAVKLNIKPSKLGSIFSIKDSREIVLSIPNAPSDIDSLLVRFECKDASGKPVQALPALVRLEKKSAYRALVKLNAALGYFDVFYTLVAEIGGQQKQISTGSFSTAVIPGNAVNCKQPKSPFGVNTHFNQGWLAETGEIVAKIGIGWIRDGEASMNDAAYPVAQANNLCYLPCFTWYGAPRTANKVKEGKWDFSDVVEWHRKYAAKYGKGVDYYDLMNEPHGMWGGVLGGSWDGGAWQKVFLQYGRQVTQAIKSADPGAKVLWEDIDRLMWYRQFYELGADAKTIDIISPHPYNMHRARPLPEEQPVLEDMPIFKRFVREHRLQWEVWSGEVGFSSYKIGETAPMFYSPNTELGQAQLLVRMMALQLSAGVSRIFWYDFRNDGIDPTNPEHNFGLIRQDNSPKPAVVAYAILIYMTTGCRWLGHYVIGGGNDACVAMASSNKPILIAWNRRGSGSESIRVSSSVKSVTVTDIFGSRRSYRTKDHKVTLNLSESPLYVTGLTMKDIKPFLVAR